VLHRLVQCVELLLLELRGRLTRRELGLGEDLVGPLAADTREGGREELAQAAGVALSGELAERLARDPLGGDAAPVGERGLDEERVAR
jgi:hypothetical protein